MKKVLALFLCIVMCATVFVGCKDKNKDEKPEALVIMTEAVDGLFNPFFSTSAADATIVSMTQVAMLSSKFEDGQVKVAYGDNEAVVTKDFASEQIGNETVYTFVLKNGIKFSDGHPLTMEDVLFNLYVYLDPSYTGSATIYSTDIKGLSAYRTQTVGSASTDDDDRISSDARKRAQTRINELINLFMQTGKQQSGSYQADYDTMIRAIGSHSLSSGYKSAIATSAEQYKVDNSQLEKDYKYTLELFRKELESDFEGAKESYVEEPYKSREEFRSEVVCFMYSEGYVTIEWEKDPVTGKDDKSKIKNVVLNYNSDVVNSKDAAIDFVYNDKISSELHIILSAWATAQTLATEYGAKAREVILHDGLKDGELKVKNIEGIVSLGHTDAGKGSTITVNGNTYTVASAHNSDGTVVSENEYDVLQITINGVDPKAQWNFAFSVAPQHYYGEGSKVGVNIENNQFGVEYATYDFMKDVVQSPRNIKLPLGAGPYKVTNRANSDTPGTSEFYRDNVIYFKSNSNFETLGSGINNAKIEKVRYRVVGASNAINALEDGSVHYITPQLTKENYDKLENLKSTGRYNYMLTDQLGYGYIGINAEKVPDLNLRKAIMCAMNTTLTLSYYRPGTASQIYWPMSKVSWAYPTGGDGKFNEDNGHDYPQINGQFNKQIAIENIQKYMQQAGVSAGDSSLKITFTIAGSNLQDHPTYTTFRDAAALLNDLGWDITVVPDTQALTKLNTGSLAVWAAAWGSTIDPDLYQVYHKNSTATSTLAWGYKSIQNSGSREEKEILNELSILIDEARETLDQDARKALYEQAMGKILDLAIELPAYQRSVVYAYNTKVIKASSLPSENQMNPYTSPLDRIWEIEFAD